MSFFFFAPKYYLVPSQISCHGHISHIGQNVAFWGRPKKVCNKYPLWINIKDRPGTTPFHCTLKLKWHVSMCVSFRIALVTLRTYYGHTWGVTSCKHLNWTRRCICCTQILFRAVLLAPFLVPCHGHVLHVWLNFAFFGTPIIIIYIWPS